MNERLCIYTWLFETIRYCTRRAYMEDNMQLEFISENVATWSLFINID